MYIPAKNGDLSVDNTVEHACKIGQGFIYCVSVLGVTGTREKLSKDLSKKVNQVNNLSEIPVAVGFGISKNNWNHKVLWSNRSRMRFDSIVWSN